MTLYHANIAHIPGSAAPDPYDHSADRDPPEDFVVCRNVDGSTLSIYKSLKWDRSPYDPEHAASVLYFDFWNTNVRYRVPPALEELPAARAQLVRSIQWIMFTLIYLREGESLANGTLEAYCSLVRRLALWAESKSLTISEVFLDADSLLDFSRAYIKQARQLVSLLKHLKLLGVQVVGFDIVSDITITQIEGVAKRRGKAKQHPPMPTKIYSAILAALSARIDEYNDVIERILELVKACANDPRVGRHRVNQRLIQEERGLEPTPASQLKEEFPELLIRFGLSDYWARHGYVPSVGGLVGALSEIQMACFLQIQAFSGMRFKEATNLPFSCLKRQTRDGEIYFLIAGRVTKLTNGKVKRVEWVTSKAGETAILLAQKIALTVYHLRGNAPSGKTTDVNSHFLFIPPSSCMGWTQNKLKNLPGQLNPARFKNLLSCLCPNITESDILELEEVDPFRDWRGDKKFEIGNPWTLTSHQFRRSLALYAHASGLVSLPSLKRQLQHITKAMAQYYTRGFQTAMNFVDDQGSLQEKHFCTEWQEARWESELLGYINNVLKPSPDELFGAHAIWAYKNLRGSIHVLEDRLSTKKRFERGELAFRETYVGGCTKVGLCEVPQADLLNLNCLLNDCKNLVGNVVKFEKVIRIQSRLVEDLTKSRIDLPETKVEVDNLRLMEQKMAQIKMQNNHSL